MDFAACRLRKSRQRENQKENQTKMQQPTFLRFFVDDVRPTEYVAISTITQVTVEITPQAQGEPFTKVTFKTLEGATRVVTGAEALQIIDTLDHLSGYRFVQEASAEGLIR